jgi:beta-lactamase regulating signal transducer with metallopeptidase domain
VNTAMQVVAQNVVAGVLNSLPTGIGLAVLTAVLLRLMRQASASARFAVWFSALAALPLLAFLHAPGVKGSANQVQPGINVPGSWAIPAIAFWAFIAAGILARIVAGIGRIWKIRRSCVPIAQESLPGRALELLSPRSARQVEVCTSNLMQVPAAVGLFRPAIVLPEWALNDLSPDQLSAIISHELAHLQRWDDWSNLAQKLLRAVLFFHPAAWWIERQLSLAREMACDDAAVEHVLNARDYAASLVAVAEKSMIQRSILLAQAAVHRARETSLRVARLLALKGQSNIHTWSPAPFILGALAAAVFVIEPAMPRLITFQDNGSLRLAGKIPVAPATALMTPVKASATIDSLVTPASYGEHSTAKVVPANMQVLAPKTRLRRVVHKTQPAPEMLLIFQNASFDQQGMPTWNVYVLRVKWTGNTHFINRETSKRT